MPPVKSIEILKIYVYYRVEYCNFWPSFIVLHQEMTGNGFGQQPSFSFIGNDKSGNLLVEIEKFTPFWSSHYYFYITLFPFGFKWFQIDVVPGITREIPDIFIPDSRNCILRRFRESRFPGFPSSAVGNLFFLNLQ